MHGLLGAFFSMKLAVKLLSRAPPGHLLHVNNKKIVRHLMVPKRNVLSVSLCILVLAISICFLCFHVKLTDDTDKFDFYIVFFIPKLFH